MIVELERPFEWAEVPDDFGPYVISFLRALLSLWIFLEGERGILGWRRGNSQ